MDGGVKLGEVEEEGGGIIIITPGGKLVGGWRGERGDRGEGGMRERGVEVEERRIKPDGICNPRAERNMKNTKYLEDGRCEEGVCLYSYVSTLSSLLPHLPPPPPLPGLPSISPLPPLHPTPYTLSHPPPCPWYFRPQNPLLF